MMMSTDNKKLAVVQDEPLSDGVVHTAAVGTAVTRYPNLRPWVKGQSGNPGGRTPGLRNKLQNGFVAALADDFATHGPAAIEAARLEDPVGYLKLVASLLPKDVKLDARPLADWTDEELVRTIDLIERYMAAVATGEDAAH
jgi:hypothetical protein